MFLFSSSASFLAKQYLLIGGAYAVLCLPFSISLCRMVWYSLRRRELAFGAGWTRNPSISTPTSRQTIARWLDAISINGGCFTLFLLAQESSEVVLETVQAYRSSRSISSLAINQAYGLMILLNCWGTPVILRYSKNRLLGRLLCVLMDVVLDFAWGTIIQGMLFWPYYQIYLHPHGGVWTTPDNAERELEQILVVSVGNFVFSVFPFVSSIMALRDVCSVLDHAEISTRQRVRVVPVQPAEARQGPLARKVMMVKQPRYVKAWCWCMIVHGMVIFCVSIAASGIFSPDRGNKTTCINQVYPWFRNTIACVGGKVSCNTWNVRGGKAEMVEMLRELNSEIVAYLEIQDCPALEVPSMVHDFFNIATLRVSNSTIVEWLESASITDPYFPQLNTLAFVDVTFGCIPPGLITRPLPSAFEWLAFKNSNVYSFIHLVSDAWLAVLYWYCVNCGLLEIPDVVYNMNGLLELVVPSNHITSLNTTAVVNKPGLYIIQIAVNPISSLPNGVWGLLNQLQMLDMQYTGILSYPDSETLQEDTIGNVRGYETPLCNHNDRTTPLWLDCNEHPLSG